MNVTVIHNNDGGRERKPSGRSRLGAGLIILILLALVMAALQPVTVTATAGAGRQIEPEAGSWRTWVLASGSQLRPVQPPGKVATKVELMQLRRLAQERDRAALDRIAYWNTGAPSYRWNQIAVGETLSANMPSPVAGRALALIHAAVYDATIAAWDAKYAFNRPRPGQLDRKLTTVIDNPRSPSYPAEHAVTAGAASEVLAYLFPARADFFREQAEQAGEAFLIAGVQYPSDVEVGMELGRQVAALVIERGRNDNSGTVWDGTMPQGPGYWSGTNPALPMAGTWKTWVLEDGSEFRPQAPPAYDSQQLAAEMNELRNFARTPKTNNHALFYEYGAGGTRNHAYWNEILSRKLLEFDYDDNAPRSARAFALVNIAYYDAMVACWDAKYTYWAIRPFQLDPDFRPLFTTPNHPSYPSAHGCLSGSAAEMLAYLFPRDAQALRASVTDINESRIWAGLHFRSDIVAAKALAEAVAAKTIEIARNDGSQ